MTHIPNEAARGQRSPIKHAAIKKDGIVYVGSHHAHCISVMAECGLSFPVTKDAEQGFVDEAGNFLDRVSALEVAQAFGQIVKKHHPLDELMSEDLKGKPDEQS